MTQRKKPSKKERLEKRKEHADLWNRAFSMGYEFGVNEGYKLSKEGLALEIKKIQMRD